VFADPKLRHHEAVAEAELDIDYGDSPIVMGSRHDVLSPGQRLPDTIEVHLADGTSCMLHELASHAGHIACRNAALAARAEDSDCPPYPRNRLSALPPRANSSNLAGAKADRTDRHGWN
jgi:hypothetical protein